MRRRSQISHIQSRFTKNKNYLYTAADQLKHNWKSEQIAFYRLRVAGLSYLFERQVPFHNRVFDFFSEYLWLGLEVDGSQHNIEKDRIRDGQYFRQFKVRTLRVRAFSRGDMNNVIELVQGLLFEKKKKEKEKKEEFEFEPPKWHGKKKKNRSKQLHGNKRLRHKSFYSLRLPSVSSGTLEFRAALASKGINIFTGAEGTRIRRSVE